MKTHEEIEKYLLSFPDVKIDHSLGEDITAYKLAENNKIFALVFNNSKPPRISLKCDPQLAKKLREDFETVMPAENLSKKYWNTVICSGQLPDDDIKGLAILSYNLVTGATEV